MKNRTARMNSFTRHSACACKAAEQVRVQEDIARLRMLAELATSLASIVARRVSSDAEPADSTRPEAPS